MPKISLILNILRIIVRNLRKIKLFFNLKFQIASKRILKVENILIVIGLLLMVSFLNLISFINNQKKKLRKKYL